MLNYVAQSKQLPMEHKQQPSADTALASSMMCLAS